MNEKTQIALPITYPVLMGRLFWMVTTLVLPLAIGYIVRIGLENASGVFRPLYWSLPMTVTLFTIGLMHTGRFGKHIELLYMFIAMMGILCLTAGASELPYSPFKLFCMVWFPIIASLGCAGLGIMRILFPDRADER